MILSYPRSGNHLTRFIIEYISSRPTMGCYNSLSDTPINERFHGDRKTLEHVSKNKNFIAYKFHKNPFFDFIFNKRIIIIRDWRDAITSHAKKGSDHSEDFIRKTSKSYIDIIRNIKENDLVVDYKELLNDRKKVCLEIFEYLNLKDDEYFNKLLENIDYLYDEAAKSPINKPVSNKNQDYYKNDELREKIEKIFIDLLKRESKELYNNYV